MLGTSARFFQKIYNLVTRELFIVHCCVFPRCCLANFSFAQRVEPRLGYFKIFFLGFLALFSMGARLITVYSSGSRTPDSIGDLVDIFLSGAVAKFLNYFLFNPSF